MSWTNSLEILEALLDAIDELSYEDWEIIAVFIFLFMGVHSIIGHIVGVVTYKTDDNDKDKK
tara:strand:+ start:83 stop:268 length:186 start_codon:yes stop_codon:yes gene_type:complete